MKSMITYICYFNSYICYSIKCETRYSKIEQYYYLTVKQNIVLSCYLT